MNCKVMISSQRRHSNQAYQIMSRIWIWEN